MDVEKEEKINTIELEIVDYWPPFEQYCSFLRVKVEKTGFRHGNQITLFDPMNQ